ncbi:MAG: ABC transporter permease subunit [Chloroflexi bacterium]|nr:ABC transporter permease subunit [Chloroflexota bacterium]
MWTAILNKELTSRLRGRLAYVLLTLMAAASTGLVLAGFWLVVLNVPTLVPSIGSAVGTGTASATIQTLVGSARGTFLFLALAICMVAAVLAVAPAIASSAVTSEREAGTYDLLLGTGIPAGSLVFGKLIAAVAFALLLSLTSLPGFAIAWMFGGVATKDAAIALVVVLATVMFVSACGLFVSALSRSSVLASLAGYGLAFFIGLGTLLVYIVGASTQNEAIVRPLLSLNPFIALATIPDQLALQVAQTMPFQYRSMLDLSAQDWLGMSLKYPRWMDTVGIYLLGTVVVAALTAIAADPCHRLRPRSNRLSS